MCLAEFTSHLVQRSSLFEHSNGVYLSLVHLLNFRDGVNLLAPLIFYPVGLIPLGYVLISDFGDYKTASTVICVPCMLERVCYEPVFF